MANPNILLEQRFGITDPTFEQANLYRKSPLQVGLEGSARFQVYSGYSEWGSAEAVVPSLDVLCQRGSRVYVMTKNQGEVFLKSSGWGLGQLKHVDPFRRIREMRAVAVLTGMSGQSPIEVVMNETARKKGIPVAAYENFPGGYMYNLEETFKRIPQAMPDRLLVWNEWAREENLRHLPSSYQDQVIVVGQPALDVIARSDKDQIRREFRQRHGLDNDVTLITWFGQVGGATVESLKVFLQGLDKVIRVHPELDYRLVYRFHPNDENVKQGVYEDILSPFKSRLIYAGREVERDVMTVIAASDLNVQERSTIAMTSAAWRVPAVSIAIPEINERWGVMPGLRVPVTEDGTSPLVDSPEKMPEVLEKVLFDAVTRKELDERMQSWGSDGRSAENVADQVMDMAGLK